MSGKRIAIVADTFPPGWAGGIASSHFHIHRLLAKAGHDVRTFTCYDSVAGESPEAVRRKIPPLMERMTKTAARLFFRLADPGHPAYQTADILLRAWGAWRLNAALAVFRPDIVILPDHGAPGLFLKRLGGERRCLIAHHNPSRFLELPVLGRHSARDIGIALSLEQRVLKDIDQVVCPSAYMARTFAASLSFKGPVDVVHNMLDPDFMGSIAPADLRAQLGLPPDALIVAIPAGGNKFKGARFVPELIRRIAKASAEPLGFFISGSVPGELSGELAYMPANARLFTPGGQPATQALAYLQSCDFALLPSLVENFSMAGLECLHYGLPVVAFDTGGNAELIQDGLSGFVVPYLDVEAFVVGAVSLLDRQRLAALKQGASRDAASRLGSDAQLAKLQAALGIG